MMLSSKSRHLFHRGLFTYITILIPTIGGAGMHTCADYVRLYYVMIVKKVVDKSRTEIS
jgi:hypothetical protein